MSGLQGSDRENLFELLPLDLIQVDQPKMGASPGLVLVQRLATFVE